MLSVIQHILVYVVGPLRQDKFIFPLHTLVWSPSAGLKQDQTAWDAALMFLDWCCYIQYQPTGTLPDLVDIYRGVSACMWIFFQQSQSVLWQVNKQDYSCPSCLFMSLPISAFLHASSAMSRWSRSAWLECFPQADMKSHIYYSQVMLSFIFNSARKSQR